VTVAAICLQQAAGDQAGQAPGLLLLVLAKKNHRGFGESLALEMGSTLAPRGRWQRRGSSGCGHGGGPCPGLPWR